MEDLDRTQEFDTVELEPKDNGSLASRMAQRADYLEKHQSQWFGVPGYEDLIEVQLRALPFSTILKIQQRNQKIRDEATQALYNLADNLVFATMGFRELTEDAPIELQDDWIGMARRLPDAPPDLTPRRAILFLVDEKRMHFLAQEWGEWAASTRRDVDEEVVRDFEPTGSSS